MCALYNWRVGAHSYAAAYHLFGCLANRVQIPERGLERASQVLPGPAAHGECMTAVFNTPPLHILKLRGVCYLAQARDALLY